MNVSICIILCFIHEWYIYMKYIVKCRYWCRMLHAYFTLFLILSIHCFVQMDATQTYRWIVSYVTSNVHLWCTSRIGMHMCDRWTFNRKDKKKKKLNNIPDPNKKLEHVFVVLVFFFLFFLLVTIHRIPPLRWFEAKRIKQKSCISDTQTLNRLVSFKIFLSFTKRIPARNA